MTAVDPMGGFSAPARTWFTDVFASPTPVQAAAWERIASGEHTLVVAPTGSGKTLSAFFWALDKLATTPEAKGTRVLYVSPLKALGVDVERNLRAPLVGIRRTAERLGEKVSDITVGVRSGDTPTKERAALLRRPPDVLITTPESLYLMLTSSAKATLVDVETVIIDEIHAIAGTKRGSHLALSLERLDAQLGREVQRIALSATVRPIEKVATFLGGDRRVAVVAPPSNKQWNVHVRVPVPDITDPGPRDSPVDLDPLLSGGDPTGPEPSPTNSLWPHVEAEVFDSVVAGRSTLVFTNSRRVAERLTSRLNEMWAEKHDPESLVAPGRRPPAQVMQPFDEVGMAPAIIARAHHGSVSKEARAEIEMALKSGDLKCVVATSSLELGIDMGAVDRVIQVSAPPSVASSLQRIGRAGHHVGAVSVGDVFPMHRGDLMPSAVSTARMLEGAIEELRIPRSPLDVLAQQTLAAAVAAGEAGLDIDEWFTCLTRSMPYAGLDRSVFDSIVDLLAGAYPSADFGELRARLDVEDGRMIALRGSLRLAVTSGGTIPDRGMFGVFLATDQDVGRRVGELDEEMVYESRVGDVFTLGASSWRIQEITQDQVRVIPAPGHTGRLPFWHGDAEGRPAELGLALGRFHREVLRTPGKLDVPYLDENTATNIRTYLREQKEATGSVPDDTTIVLERFRDEVGDWRCVLHSPLGRGVLGAWALAIGEALSREAGIDVVPVASDDGIIWRLPDSDAAERLSEILAVSPDEVGAIVTEQVGGTALFAARFRECAARALLLPRRNPGKRAPLWQQRQRASQLLEVARLHPRFPIIIETVREVLQDVYDLPALITVLQGLQRGSMRIVEVVTNSPSPFAATMLFRYTGAQIYEGDSPLAERRAAMLSMDPALLASVLGTVDLRELLDPAVITAVEAELQHLAGTGADGATDRRVHTPDALADLPRMLGPIPMDELAGHLDDELRPQLPGLVSELGNRVHVLQVAGRQHLVATSDLGLLRDALGIPVPAGAPAPDEIPGRDPVTQLIARYARTHAPFSVRQVADAFGLGTATASVVLEREVAARRLVEGHFTPGREGVEYCDPEVLRRIRTRCLAAARSQVQPISASAYARFLADWHQVIDPPDSSADEVLITLQRLAGAALPASAWETHVLPSRLHRYQSAHLDELVAEGEVLIRIRGSVGAGDPLIALIPRDDLDLLAPIDVTPDGEAIGLAAHLRDSGGLFGELRALRQAAEPGLSSAALADEMWRAAELGLIAPASMVPVRARIGGPSRGAHKAARPAPRRRTRLPRPGRSLLSRTGSIGGPPEVAGRWYPVVDTPVPIAEQAIAQVSAWLERFGVITRGAVSGDGFGGGFAAAYRVLAELESAGRVLRGYVVEGLGGSQFATSATIDQVRVFADSPDETPWPSGVAEPEVIVLSAIDPANPYGNVLPWPKHPTARPSRAAGALVVLADGVCLAHISRGGRQLTLYPPAWPQAPSRPELAAMVTAALKRAALNGRLARAKIEEVDGERVGATDLMDAMRGAGARVSPQGVIIEGSNARG